MKVFNIILGFLLGFLIVINLFQMIMVGTDVVAEPRGFKFFIEGFSQISLFDNTIGSIKAVGEIISNIPNVHDLWEGIVSFGLIVGSVFYIPISAIIDILTLVYQIFSIFLGFPIN